MSDLLEYPVSSEPWTPARLLDLSTQQDLKYRHLLEMHPPGTVHEGRNSAHQRSEQALACAEWMERNGIERLRLVGPFGTLSFTRGQHVRLAKGSIIYGTGSGIPRGGKPLGRETAVTLHSIDPGYVDVSTREVRQPKVTWAGSGGYWRWTDANNVLPDPREGREMNVSGCGPEYVRWNL